MTFLALGPEWLQPDTIISWLGPWAVVGLAAIVFAECGLLLGFFLPGDSLLFTAGLFVANGAIGAPLWVVCLVLVTAAFVGNVCGYYIGRAAGPAIFDKPRSRLFNPAHVVKTQEFFDKYGNRAIVLGRFVPIVRTFITVMAGVGQMEPKRYLTYSLIGGVLWAAGVTVLGFWLGQFEFVRTNIELILILIVFVSMLPIVIELVRARRRHAPDRVQVGPQVGSAGRGRRLRAASRRRAGPTGRPPGSPGTGSTAGLRPVRGEHRAAGGLRPAVPCRVRVGQHQPGRGRGQLRPAHRGVGQVARGDPGEQPAVAAPAARQHPVRVGQSVGHRVDDGHRPVGPALVPVPRRQLHAGAQVHTLAVGVDQRTISRTEPSGASRTPSRTSPESGSSSASAIQSAMATAKPSCPSGPAGWPPGRWPGRS